MSLDVVARDAMRRALCSAGVVLKPEGQVEEGGEAAQPKEVGGRDFLFAEPGPSDHFLQHVRLSSAARQHFRYEPCETAVQWWSQLQFSLIKTRHLFISTAHQRHLDHTAINSLSDTDIVLN